MNTSLVVALVLIVIIIAAGFFLFTQQGATQPPSQTGTDMQMPATGNNQATSASSPSTQTPATAGKTSVSIANFAFTPNVITVKAGETVTWTNNDLVAHTVTSDNGSFDSKNLAPGATYSHTFAAAGTYAYHCTYHPNMHGSVVVQ